MFEIHTAPELAKEHCDNVEQMCKTAIINLKGRTIFTDGQEDFRVLSTSKIEYANKRFQKFICWLEDNNYEHLSEIIMAKPHTMLDIYAEISKNFNFEIYEGSEMVKVFATDGIKGKVVKDNIEKIFNYKNFSYDFGYVFAKKLNVTICPYCNRQFTFTVLNESEIQAGRREKVIRPEFDHYFSQEKYPIFALSFYNLIPSCHICNSNIKGRRELDIKKHYHPYITEDKNFKFCYDKAEPANSNIKTTIKIDYRNIPKAKETCEFFYLDIIYKAHNDVSDKLWEKYNEYPPDRFNEILEALRNIGENFSRRELLDIIFSEYKVNDPDKEILGKLRSDLYEQMKQNYK